MGHTLHRIREGRLTDGLRIPENATWHKLTPTNITERDAPDMGLNGARLFSPDRSVVGITSALQPMYILIVGFLEHGFHIFQLSIC